MKLIITIAKELLLSDRSKSLEAANDDDPFEAEFQKAAGNEKLDPTGGPFGLAAHIGCHARE
jgi:hypothetical protein